MVGFVKLSKAKAFILKYAKLSQMEQKSGVGAVTINELTLLECPVNAEILFLSKDFSADHGGFFVDIFKRTYVDTLGQYSTYSKIGFVIMQEEKIKTLGAIAPLTQI